MHMEVAELADMMLIMKVGKVADMVLPLVMKILPRTKFDSSGWISQFWQNFIISAKLPGIPKIGQFRNFCDVSSYDCWCWPLVVISNKIPINIIIESLTIKEGVERSKVDESSSQLLPRHPVRCISPNALFLLLHMGSCGTVELWNCGAVERLHIL